MKTKQTMHSVLRLCAATCLTSALWLTTDEVWAEQTDTIRTEASDGEIKLSSAFQKELYKAFQMGPTPTVDTPAMTAIELDRKQLHEWLGHVAADDAPLVLFDMPGLKDALKDVYVWRSKSGQYGVLQRADGTTCFSGLDVNALGRYIRPSEIRIRKAQELSASARPLMDRILPMDGLPSITLQDSAFYMKK